MDRETFRSVLSGVESAIRDTVAGDEGTQLKRKKSCLIVDDKATRLRYPESDFNNLEKVRILGTGMFGVVYHMQQKGSGVGACCTPGHGSSHMAMKVVSSGLLVSRIV